MAQSHSLISHQQAGEQTLLKRVVLVKYVNHYLPLPGHVTSRNRESLEIGRSVSSLSRATLFQHLERLAT